MLVVYHHFYGSFRLNLHTCTCLCVCVHACTCERAAWVYFTILILFQCLFAFSLVIYLLDWADTHWILSHHFDPISISCCIFPYYVFARVSFMILFNLFLVIVLANSRNGWQRYWEGTEVQSESISCSVANIARYRIHIIFSILFLFMKTEEIPSEDVEFVHHFFSILASSRGSRCTDVQLFDTLSSLSSEQIVFNLLSGTQLLLCLVLVDAIISVIEVPRNARTVYILC